MSKWIPVWQDLPKQQLENNLVVTLKNLAVFPARWSIDEFKNNSLDMKAFHPENPVIAWKKMPAPYRGRTTKPKDGKL